MTNWFRIESRRNWRRSDTNDPTNDDLKLGCLQRIADASESIAQSLDPEARKRSTERQREATLFDAWNKLQIRPSSVRSVVGSFFKPANPDRKEKLTIREITSEIYSFLSGLGFDWNEMPTDEQKAEIAKRKAEFDLKTFDWNSLKLTQLHQKRLNDLLERLKQAETG